MVDDNDYDDDDEGYTEGETVCREHQVTQQFKPNHQQQHQRHQLPVFVVTRTRNARNTPNAVAWPRLKSCAPKRAIFALLGVDVICTLLATGFTRTRNRHHVPPSRSVSHAPIKWASARLFTLLDSVAQRTLRLCQR